MKLPLIIAHGGAGPWKDEKIPIGVDHVKESAIAGFKILEQGGSALDAAEICTLHLENSGMFDAGIGSFRNQDGEQELDAMIVDGRVQNFGAVAGVKGIQNPVSLARYIMEQTEYSFFVGPKAEKLYKRMIDEKYRKEKTPGVITTPISPENIDTVGCVVVDIEGSIAVTSSTGGIKNKIPGRVGDSPIMGSGAFADSLCGVSATGYGEHIMRVVLSRMIASYVEEGMDVQAAAERGLKMFIEKTSSEAGIILVDNQGNWGKTTNAKAMPTVIIQGSIKKILSFEK